MDELEYLFKHALAQEAAYESILHQKRKDLHIRVGNSIEKVFKERLHEFYGMLAYHYIRGEDEEKAEEDDMKITHYGKESGPGTGTGVFQGVDLESSAPSPGKIGGEGVRELRTDDLDKPADIPELGSESVNELDLDRPPRPVSRPQPSPSGKAIALKTDDKQKAKYLRLVVALAEANYFDQAIEALSELRGLGAG